VSPRQGVSRRPFDIHLAMKQVPCFRGQKDLYDLCFIRSKPLVRVDGIQGLSVSNFWAAKLVQGLSWIQRIRGPCTGGHKGPGSWAQIHSGSPGLPVCQQRSVETQSRCSALYLERGHGQKPPYFQALSTASYLVNYMTGCPFTDVFRRASSALDDMLCF